MTSRKTAAKETTLRKANREQKGNASDVVESRKGTRRKDVAYQDITLSQTFNLIVSLVNGEPLGSERVN